MSAVGCTLPDHLKENVFVAVMRNLLLYALLLQFFAFDGTSLFSAPQSESDKVADVSSDAGNLYNQVILPAIFFGVCSVAYAYRVPVRILLAPMIPMLPFFIVMALSAAWSDYPELTIRRASREIIEATSLALLACCFSNATVLLRTLFRAFVAIGSLDLLAAAVFPDSLTYLGFAGIHGHKNLAGQFFFVALPIYLLGALYTEVSGNRLLGLLSLILGVVMLVLTESKTSVGATIVGFSSILLTLGLFHRNPTFRLPAYLLCLIALLCIIAAMINWSANELLEALIGDPTLTGRDGIWRYAGSKFDSSPFVGVGYGAIWQVGPSIQDALKATGVLLVFNEAHNGYLEVAAQLGIVGVLCLLVFLLVTLRNALSYWDKIEKHAFCGAGAYAVYVFWGLALCNITESLYFQAGLGSFATAVFIAAFIASRNRRSRLGLDTQPLEATARRQIA
jgi:exopolysaccharide production protein ExoQ